MNEHEKATMGTPGPDVTHWRLWQKTGGKPIMLDYPDASGVRLSEWPIAELSLDIIRQRWVSGTFQVQFFAVDPTAASSRERRAPRGKGPVFTIDAPTPVAAPTVPTAANAPAGGPADMTFALSFAQAMMQMADKRTEQMIEALRATGHVPAPAAEVSPLASELAELRAELAAQRARAEAEAERRRIEDAHRAELAAREREIAELRARRARDDDDDDGPIFEPGAPLIEQAAFALLNAAARMPPEKLVGLVEVVKPLFGGRNEPPAPPPPPVRRRIVSPPPPVDVAPPSVAAAMPQQPIDGGRVADETPLAAQMPQQPIDANGAGIRVREVPAPRRAPAS